MKLALEGESGQWSIFQDDKGKWMLNPGNGQRNVSCKSMMQKHSNSKGPPAPLEGKTATPALQVAAVLPGMSSSSVLLKLVSLFLCIPH